MRDLDRGRIIQADFLDSSGNRSAGRHSGIVLNTKQEIESSGVLEVAVISSNDKLALPEDMVEVPRMVLPNKKKRCWVICSWYQQLDVNGDFDIGQRKAFGPFLAEVVAKVRALREPLDSAESEPPWID